VTTPPARGLLYTLEQHRLRAHSTATLVSARTLMDQLLDMAVLPGVVADMLRLTRDEFADAAEAEGAH